MLGPVEVVLRRGMLGASFVVVWDTCLETAEEDLGSVMILMQAYIIKCLRQAN